MKNCSNLSFLDDSCLTVQISSLFHYHIFSIHLLLTIWIRGHRAALLADMPKSPSPLSRHLFKLDPEAFPSQIFCWQENKCS